MCFYPISIKAKVSANQGHVNNKDPSALTFQERREVFDLECKGRNVSDWLSASHVSEAICVDYVKTLTFPHPVEIVEVVGGDMIKKRDDGITRIYFGRGRFVLDLDKTKGKPQKVICNFGKFLHFC